MFCFEYHTFLGINNSSEDGIMCVLYEVLESKMVVYNNTRFISNTGTTPKRLSYSKSACV
jgi:hypothetical protein